MLASFASQVPVHCCTTKSESPKHSMFRMPISLSILMPCTRASYSATLFDAQSESGVHSAIGLLLVMSGQPQPLDHSSSSSHQNAFANDLTLERVEHIEFQPV